MHTDIEYTLHPGTNWSVWKNIWAEYSMQKSSYCPASHTVWISVLLHSHHSFCVTHYFSYLVQNWYIFVFLWKTEKPLYGLHKQVVTHGPQNNKTVKAKYRITSTYYISYCIYKQHYIHFENVSIFIHL